MFILGIIVICVTGSTVGALVQPQFLPQKVLDRTDRGQRLDEYGARIGKLFRAVVRRV